MSRLSSKIYTNGISGTKSQVIGQSELIEDHAFNTYNGYLTEYEGMLKV